MNKICYLLIKFFYIILLFYLKFTYFEFKIIKLKKFIIILYDIFK